MQLIKLYQIKHYSPIKCELRRSHSAPNPSLEEKKSDYRQVPGRNRSENYFEACRPGSIQGGIDSVDNAASDMLSKLRSSDPSSSERGVGRLIIFLDGTPQDLTSSIFRPDPPLSHHLDQVDSAGHDSAAGVSIPLEEIPKERKAVYTAKEKSAEKSRFLPCCNREKLQESESDEETELAKETAEALKLMCRCLEDPAIQNFFQ